MRRSMRRRAFVAVDAPAAKSAQLRTNGEQRADSSAAVGIHAGAAILSAAVLVDSALEHYRGGFFRSAMYVAPMTAGLACGAATLGVRNAPGQHPTRDAVYVLAAIVGATGTWFHLMNVSRRGGGPWTNVFYGAPAAAPLGLHVAGLLGLCADQLQRGDAPRGLQRRLASSSVVILSAVGLLGTSAEAWLFHFRGAFQNPFMYAPVVLPPIAAGALCVATVTRDTAWARAADLLLRATATLGVVGVGFHAYGVQRRMGGWRNWTQNLFSGPPVPAPLAFTALALAGLAALRVARTRGEF